MQIYVDVTNHCNKKCSFCPMKDRYTENLFPMGFMDWSLYVSIIDQLPKGTNVDFHKDGEPLLHPQIEHMILYAKEKGMFTHLVTNGILLGRMKYKIVYSELDLLTVSIIDEIPFESINTFMYYKGDEKPFTQLKTYGDHDLLPLSDKVLEREVHNWTDDLERKTQKPCSKLLNSLAITWDGYYTVCCVDYQRESARRLITVDGMLKRNKEIYDEQCAGVFTAPCSHCNYWN
jgi:hypothetical protein